MKLYKLTNQMMETYNDLQWEIGKQINLMQIENPRLCSADVIHAYRGINLALLINPIHANIKNPRCFEAEEEICIEDWGKVGCFSFNLIKEIELPQWTRNIQKERRVQIQFAILCAEAVLFRFQNKYPDDGRPRKAIEAARRFLGGANAADAAHAAHAAYAAADAAYAAADAAYAAADAAYAAADAAYAAAHAADCAAADAAYAAAHAADCAAACADYADAAIDFSTLADQAVGMQG